MDIVQICVNTWWKGKQMNQRPGEKTRGYGHKFGKLEFLGLWKERLLTVWWLILQRVTQRGGTILLGILENHLDMIPLEFELRQLNLGDLQRWLPASIILCCWVFPVCLLSHYWEYLKNKQKNPNPQNKRKNLTNPKMQTCVKKPYQIKL